MFNVTTKGHIRTKHNVLVAYQFSLNFCVRGIPPRDSLQNLEQNKRHIYLKECVEQLPLSPLPVYSPLNRILNKDGILVCFQAVEMKTNLHFSAQ